MKARSALFTLFGDVVRPAGGEAWLSTITACMGTLGFTSQAVRTALHRMAAEGWVEPRREGRYAAYRLTPRGVVRLEEAAERIYRLRSLAWDGAWRLLLAPDLADGSRARDLPASARGRDDVVAELEWTGYGRLQPGVWVHPHPHPDTAVALLEGTGVDATWVDGAAVADDAALAARAWALDDLRARHEAFLEAWEDVAVPAEGEAALGTRLRLVHEWRGFLFLDPGLPAEVLPPDWPGLAAAKAFARVYEALREPSWAWVVELQASSPAAGPEARIVESDSPFAQGLAVMQQG